MHVDWLRPEGLPPEIGAVMSTRRGGVSVRPWDTLNLGLAAGDAADAVTCNRERFAQALGAAIGTGHPSNEHRHHRKNPNRRCHSRVHIIRIN